MKAKNILRISLFAVILCAITIFGVMADDSTTEPIIIRWTTSNTVAVNPDDAIATVARRIDMPAETAYNETSAAPDFVLPEANKFDLEKYPYVKIKMRTNYPYTIQFYTLNDKGINYSVLSNANIKDGNWHKVELFFNSANKGTKNWQSYTSSEGKSYSTSWQSTNTTATISKPFFQFKDNKTGTPDGDFFAEIEYIGFFATEKAMKEYDADPSVVRVTGEQLYNHIETAAQKETTSIVDDALRINSVNKSDGNTVNIYGIFKDIYGNNLDLYEYPYAKIKLKTNYTKTLQLYVASGVKDKDSAYKYYVAFNDNSVKTDDTWQIATLAFNSENATNNHWKINFLSGATFPTAKDEFTFNGVKFQVKTEYQEGKYLDIAYVAFYKDKETMLADDAYESEALANAIKYAEEANFEYMLHQTVGETAIEDYVRETIEAENDGISVAANANDFKYGDKSCTVDLSISDGITTRTTSVEVAIDYLTPITLETLGAQIRPIENGDIKADLRFGTKLAYDDEVYNIVDCGTVLLPKNYRNTEYAFEKATVKGCFGVGAKKRGDGDDEVIIVNDKKVTYKYYRALDSVAEFVNDIEGKDYKIFTAVITEIPYTDDSANEYNTVIVARPYVTYALVGDTSGKTFTYYGTVIERSVNQVKEAVVDNDIVGTYDSDNN